MGIGKAVCVSHQHCNASAINSTPKSTLRPTFFNNGGNNANVDYAPCHMQPTPRTTRPSFLNNHSGNQLRASCTVCIPQTQLTTPSCSFNISPPSLGHPASQPAQPGCVARGSPGVVMTCLSRPCKRGICTGQGVQGKGLATMSTTTSVSRPKDR
jgi:hypothetical protein